MSNIDDSPLIFSDETPEEKAKTQANPWKIFIVDDDEEVHQVTKLALSGFSFGGRPIIFLHAYSGAEARDIFAKTHDIAMVLLDVVMETDQSGLDVVKYVRETLGNRMTRIVLRTGQPGQAPEKQVISEYDINDYKEKTELTSQKLFTLMSASLRSYRDMVALNESRKGLRKIIDASATLFSTSSMHKFAEGALEQMLSMLHIQDNGSFYGTEVDSLAACKKGTHFKVLAGTGRFEALHKNNSELAEIPLEVIEHISKAAQDGDQAFEKNHIHVFDKDHIVSYHKGRSDHENLLYVGGDIDYPAVDKSLIELYARNVGIAFENIELHDQLEATQREIVYRLGEAVETRSMETGNHLKRVAEISGVLALEYGLSQHEAELIKYASPLHDVGKIGIPDAILNKPGRLDAEEWKIMQTHSMLGYKMLTSSEKPILQAGATIALEHHEKWDGSGYPHSKKGDEIHIFGRISALADVFDALSSRRCYKEPWSTDDIHTHILAERGKHFEPKLVDVLDQNFDVLLAILERYADKPAGGH